MNKSSRDKNHAVARTSEWVVSAVKSLSSTQKKKEKLCASQVQELLRRCLPSRSSFWKLVPCRERSPPLSTTASSSFLCWTKQCCAQISNTCHECQVCAKLTANIHFPTPSHSCQHPLFRSWSKAEFQSLIHPQPLRLEQGRHLHQCLLPRRHALCSVAVAQIM